MTKQALEIPQATIHVHNRIQGTSIMNATVDFGTAQPKMDYEGEHPARLVDPDNLGQIFKNIRGGTPQNVAAANAGIPQSVLSRWENQGLVIFPDADVAYRTVGGGALLLAFAGPDLNLMNTGTYPIHVIRPKGYHGMIGALLRRQRVAVGLSLHTLAQRTWTQTSAISQFETRGAWDPEYNSRIGTIRRLFAPLAAVYYLGLSPAAAASVSHKSLQTV